MGNGGAIFATLPSVLLALAQGGLHTPSGSQFAGHLQNDNQDLITTGSRHSASFFLLGITYIHTLFIAACTAETCKIFLLHLRKLITSDQVWSQYHGKHYLTSDLLHLQRRKGRKKCMKIVEEIMSSLRMSVKLQRCLDNFNSLKCVKVCTRKSSDSTPQYAAAKWPS